MIIYQFIANCSYVCKLLKISRLSHSGNCWFDYDEEITFSWKTINADKVSLKPFGTVLPIGQKTYKIKDFQNPSITVELTAENSIISRQVRSTMNLKNITYEKLYQHFKHKINEESNTTGQKA